MSDRTDRKDFREALGTTFKALLEGTSKPASAFYDHLESSFDGRSPVVCLTSAGTTPVPLTIRGWRYEHRVMFLVFVARDDASADDTLDDCYQAIADGVEANRTTADWKDLRFDGPSQIDDTVWGGDPYWVEQIPVVVEGY